MPLKTIKHNRGTYSGWKARSLAEAVAEAPLLTRLSIFDHCFNFFHADKLLYDG